MRSEAKLWGQTQSIASTLIQWPANTILFFYVHEGTAEKVKTWLREIAVSFPCMADWEQRVTFEKAGEPRKFETLPKITFDEWIPPEER